jgi:hypothetical protein
MTILKYIQLLLIIMGFTACRNYEEPLDPCESRMPPISGTNVVVFKDTDGDTLQVIDFENVDVPVVIKGTSDILTTIIIHIKYNDIYHNSDLNQSNLLFNGALCFSVLAYFEKDTVNTDQYELNSANIWFQNGYYSSYNYIKTEDSESGITKIGNVFDKIDGFFRANFVNFNNQSDTLLVDFDFSAIRWCY